MKEIRSRENKKGNLEPRRTEFVNRTQEHTPCCYCCCKVASVVSDSVRTQRLEPTRLPHPWDSPGKNTGVDCHFLLQSMKVKSESKIIQSCPTLRNPMDCSLPGSSIHGIFQARVLEWGAIAFSGTHHNNLYINWCWATESQVKTSYRGENSLKYFGLAKKVDIIHFPISRALHGLNHTTSRSSLLHSLIYSNIL